MSNRRVRKGPGRRPRSAKRRRFMELIGRGWSIRAAGGGCLAHRGEQLGTGLHCVPQRSCGRLRAGSRPPAVLEVSTRYLSQDEWIEIADLHHAGLSIRGIAARIGRAASTLRTPAKVLLSIARRCLRTGRDHRRAQQRVALRRRRFDQPMRSVHERPFHPTDRFQAGHWEGDLIIGKDQGSAIGTLVERTTRTVRVLHLRPVTQMLCTLP